MENNGIEKTVREIVVNAIIRIIEARIKTYSESGNIVSATDALKELRKYIQQEIENKDIVEINGLYR
ncbi:MAG: hypothetical protein AAB340_02315 [Patescibacteria group bacterium]